MPKAIKKSVKQAAVKAKPRTRPKAPVSTFKPTKLKLLSPVPSDIDIAQAAKLQPVRQVAEAAGLLPAELEMYGE